jgi:putative peptide zinc metalloprotease protein
MTRPTKEVAMRRLLALVTTVTACTLSLALPAIAGGPDNVVTASPTEDGEAIHRSSVQVTATGADSVDSSNVAQAIPQDCTGCEGIAVAFQAVIMTGKPSSVTPSNIAAAVNTNCTSCRAFAFAYQYVVSADRGAGLSREGRMKVGRIRRQADDLVDAGLPYPDLDARLKGLAAEFKAAIVSDLQRSGDRPHDGERELDTEEA